MVDSLIEDLENSDYDRLGLDSLQFDEEAMDQDLALLRELDRTEQTRKESFYRKRATK